MLTKTGVDAARPKDWPFMLWDDELSGFGCIVHLTGWRSFIVQYRLRGARKSRRVSLSEYGSVTVAKARKQAGDMLAQAKLGHDPQAVAKARAAAEAALTVSALKDHYLKALRDNRITTKRLEGRAPTPAYVSDTARHLQHFADKHGEAAAETITRTQVRLFLDQYSHQASVHRRAHGALHRMYQWAIQRDLVTCANPTADIETSTNRARERVLSLNEVMQIWRAADASAAPYGDVIKLMLLTGQRRNEVAAMRWGEIDLAQAIWTLPQGRTKNRRQHAVPLPSLAMETLRARRAAFQGAPDPADLVLPTLSRDGKRLVPVSGWSWIKRSLGAEVAGWQLHDFRRTIVSLCAEGGGNVAVLDSILNHAASATLGGVTGVYQHASLLEPARAAMQRWDEMLRAALKQPAPPEANESKVVSLASRTA